MNYKATRFPHLIWQILQRQPDGIKRCNLPKIPKTFRAGVKCIPSLELPLRVCGICLVNLQKTYSENLNGLGQKIELDQLSSLLFYSIIVFLMKKKSLLSTVTSVRPRTGKYRINYEQDLGHFKVLQLGV